MVASMMAVFTNLILDYCLIFGAMGFPVLGVKGAALATIIARFIECFIVVIWTHFNPNINKYIVGAYRSLHIPSNILKDILYLCLKYKYLNVICYIICFYAQ